MKLFILIVALTTSCDFGSNTSEPSTEKKESSQVKQDSFQLTDKRKSEIGNCTCTCLYTGDDPETFSSALIVSSAKSLPRKVCEEMSSKKTGLAECKEDYYFKGPCTFEPFDHELEYSKLEEKYVTNSPICDAKWGSSFCCQEFQFTFCNYWKNKYGTSCAVATLYQEDRNGHMVPIVKIPGENKICFIEPQTSDVASCYDGTETPTTVSDIPSAAKVRLFDWYSQFFRYDSWKLKISNVLSDGTIHPSQQKFSCGFPVNVKAYFRGNPIDYNIFVQKDFQDQTGTSYNEIMGNENPSAYFFKNSEYHGYDRTIEFVSNSAARPISNWKGLPSTFHSNIDAALRVDDYVYFFKGNQYVRFNIPDNKMDDGYPITIAESTWGFPVEFHSDIDAAVNWLNGKAYFFKGDKYIRYDLEDSSVDEGYPMLIEDGWDGFPTEFSQSVDAALNWRDNNAYFFKGNQYLRFDTRSSIDKVDDGYPKVIKNVWNGVTFDSIDAAVDYFKPGPTIDTNLPTTSNFGTF